MRIAFAGTPHFAQKQLAALLDHSYDIVVVYTQPDKPSGRGQHITTTPVKSLALECGIPVEQPHTLRSPVAEKQFSDYAVDVMIVAAYGLILPPYFLETPHYGCINVHASLLPRWRGASPIQQAILAGDTMSGVTLMQMDEGLDTGNILTQLSCPLSPTETAQSLHDKLAILGATSLIENLPHLGSLIPQPQDPAQVTYAPKITKKDAICQWDRSATYIERQIRAFQPWPILHSTIDNHVIRIGGAKKITPHYAAAPGTIVEHHSEGIVVATGQESLLITHAQLPGKKMLSMSEILKSKRTLFAINRCFQPS